MGARQDLAAAIAAELDTPRRIVPYATELDTLNDPVIMLERTRVGKAPNAIGGWWIDFTLHAISPVQSRERADDVLDELLDELLTALDGIPWLKWDEAIRSTFLEMYPSFQVIVHTVTERK